MITTAFRLTLTGLAALTLVGCVHPNSPIPDDPYYAPVYPDLPPSQVVTTGSIFNDGYANELYSDIKALKVGDVITVMLTEQTKAKKSASNEISKDNQMQLDPISAGGGPITVSGNTIDLAYKEKFDMKRASDADQSNSLAGSISVNVLQVLANGNLVIRGEKWMTINDGDEFIRITGIVRPRDISPDNTIASTRVANARIQYSGTGTFADSQKSGWLSSFFSGPLWPF
ncbi:flagellar basal body L-ring protein FlgH [Ferrimonas balearica]|uniref:flagellar basal body L-ring protein FlgH n=1 Tax=Ferrimonas balearica TaxID=44012 RepID=UPI001C995A4D|nr:flagellar basal body L-ring protein FlgH [Ferrimonas balearica]MBY5992935.1 flagellar basal body L-ring protein FlgH [Ferrimonas balearica]